MITNKASLPSWAPTGATPRSVPAPDGVVARLAYLGRPNRIPVGSAVAGDPQKLVGGWVDDDLAFTHPWHFDVSNIAVPVLIIYGSDDVLVPSAHGGRPMYRAASSRSRKAATSASTR